MIFNDLFQPTRIITGLNVSSKKHLFQEMAKLLPCDTDIKMDDQDGPKNDNDSPAILSQRDIIAAVMERERLGTTGIGSGVAIPHARIEDMSDVKAVFARLDTPLEYDAVDSRPVDLIVLLVAPANSPGLHLRALAHVARILRREGIRERLRAAPNDEAVHAILSQSPNMNAA